MRSFTCRQGSSNKFWNIKLSGKSFTVTFGRIGTKGQSQTKKLKDEAAAQKEHDKLIKEKLAKGYVETTPAARAQPANLREALEAALAENPDDLGNHMAYADYLQEQGDPRGELIQVQLALEDDKKSTAQRKKLQKREKELLQAHQREWLGDLAPYLLDQEGLEAWVKEPPEGQYLYRFQLRRGWLARIEGGRVSLQFCRLLARAPQVRLLRELILSGTDYEDPPEDIGSAEDIPEGVYRVQLFPLLRSRFLGNVRVLQLGQQIGPDNYHNCHMAGEAAVGLVKLMPRLEELYLLAHRVDTDRLFALETLHNLRILQVYHATHYPLRKLAKNPSLGKLTHLLCHPHAITYGADGAFIRRADVRAVLRSTTLTGLTHLQLRLSDLGDRGCKEIVDSGILERLEVLDLRHGCITDKGARTLAAWSGLRRLELLDLTGNALTEKGIAALEATGVKLLADRQWKSSGNPQDDTDYLYEGDIE